MTAEKKKRHRGARDVWQMVEIGWWSIAARAKAGWRHADIARDLGLVEWKVWYAIKKMREQGITFADPKFSDSQIAKFGRCERCQLLKPCNPCLPPTAAQNPYLASDRI